MNLFDDLNNVVSIANKIKNGEMSKINSKEIQSAIDTYKKIRSSGYGQAASVILKNTPIGKPIREWYKENVPMNIRMAARGVENTIPFNKVNTWTEKDMTPQELAQLKTVVNDTKQFPVIDRKKKEIRQNAFGYFNYSPESYNTFGNRWNMSPVDLIKESYSNPNFALMTAIGSGEIKRDKQGDQHVIDTYDFTDVGSPNTGYGSLHKLVRTNIKDYPADIKLPSNDYSVFSPIYNDYFPAQDGGFIPTRQQVYDAFKEMYLK